MTTLLRLTLAFLLSATLAVPAPFFNALNWTQPAGGSYLLSQDFEDSGTPSGWTYASGINNSTTSPLVGSRSLRGNNSNQSAQADFTAQDEVWFFCAYLSDSSAMYLQTVYIRDSSDTNLAVFGAWGASNWRLSGSGKDEFPSSSPVFGTIQYLWIRYKKGTGSNSEAEFYVSSTTTKPGSPILSWSNGSGTTQASRVHFNNGGGGPPNQWDYLRVSATAIGDAPP